MPEAPKPGFKIGGTPPSVGGQSAPAAKSSVPSTPSDPTKGAQHRIGASTVQFRMTTLGLVSNYIKCLWYGGHGVGKTELAGTSADVEDPNGNLVMDDVFYIDAEGGKTTLIDSPRIINKDRIFHVSVTDYKQIAHIHDWLRAHCVARDRNDITQLRKLESAITGVPVADIEEPRRFRTVILDSLTELEQYSVYSILQINQNNIIQDDMDVAGWPEFRKNMESVKLLVRAYRDLPMHVHFLCAQQFKQDEQKRMHYEPQLTGKLAAQVQGFVDIVGYLTMGDAKVEQMAPRRLYVQPVLMPGMPRFDAKNRKSSYKEPYFDGPTMQKIMQGTGMLKAASAALESTSPADVVAE